MSVIATDAYQATKQVPTFTNVQDVPPPLDGFAHVDTAAEDAMFDVLVEDTILAMEDQS